MFGARFLAARLPDPSLPKGGFWVVHISAGQMAALERYELS